MKSKMYTCRVTLHFWPDQIPMQTWLFNTAAALLFAALTCPSKELPSPSTQCMHTHLNKGWITKTLTPLNKEGLSWKMIDANVYMYTYSIHTFKDRDYITTDKSHISGAHLSYWLPKPDNHPVRRWTLSAPPWLHKGHLCLRADLEPPALVLSQPVIKIEQFKVSATSWRWLNFSNILTPGNLKFYSTHQGLVCRAGLATATGKGTLEPRTETAWKMSYKEKDTWTSSWTFTVCISPSWYGAIAKTHTFCRGVQ